MIHIRIAGDGDGGGTPPLLAPAATYGILRHAVHIYAQSEWQRLEGGRKNGVLALIIHLFTRVLYHTYQIDRVQRGLALVVAGREVMYFLMSLLGVFAAPEYLLTNVSAGWWVKRAGANPAVEWRRSLVIFAMWPWMFVFYTIAG